MFLNCWKNCFVRRRPAPALGRDWQGHCSEDWGHFQCPPAPLGCLWGPPWGRDMLMKPPPLPPSLAPVLRLYQRKFGISKQAQHQCRPGGAGGGGLAWACSGPCLCRLLAQATARLLAQDTWGSIGVFPLALPLAHCCDGHQPVPILPVICCAICLWCVQRSRQTALRGEGACLGWHSKAKSNPQED